ncbi:hypothetical protein HQN88_34070 [Paenibacillus qinlingensis]|nr:hypothetical protein [Paenibacillus qinlingensis]
MGTFEPIRVICVRFTAQLLLIKELLIELMPPIHKEKLSPKIHGSWGTAPY